MSRYTLPMALMLSVGMGAAGIANAESNKVHSVPATSSEKTVVDNKKQPSIPYDSIWADKSGATHVAHCRIEGLDLKSYAPPAAPQWIGVAPDKVESVSYGILPPGYVGKWHHAPGAQWVITLSGKWSTEATDGEVSTQGPGGLHFDADTSSHPRPDDKRVGHLTKQVGDEPQVQLIIRLKPGVNPGANGKCPV